MEVKSFANTGKAKSNLFMRKEGTVLEENLVINVEVDKYLKKQT